MARVYIIDHDENIYNVNRNTTIVVTPGRAPNDRPDSADDDGPMKSPSISSAPPELEKRYSSRFRNQVRREFKRSAAHRTMGFAELELSSPEDFLKKDEGVKKPELEKGHHCDHKRPPIPKDKPKITHKKTNFRTRNIENVKSATAKLPQQPRIVDSYKGNIIELKKSGLMPVYVKKKRYGKVPDHITKAKEELAAKKSAMKANGDEDDDDDELTGRRGRKMSEAVKQELLSGLKHNWMELHKVYQTLSLLTDTIAKKNRKSKLELEMKQIEKDVLYLEEHA